MKTIARLPLLFVLLAAAAYAQPMQGEGTHEGVAAPFAGEWAAFRPGGEDNTLIICAAPVTLRPLDGGRLEYQMYAGSPVTFELSDEGGSTAWAGPEPQVSVWVAEDEFQVAMIVDGAPDWSRPLVFHRCPVLPRQSYAGAPDGLAAPYEGAWSLEMPSSTGNRPNTVLTGCAAPISITAAGEKAVVYAEPGAPEGRAELSVHEGHTDWRLADAPAPWEVVWIDPDRFHVHMIGIDRVTEWRLPYIFSRCDG